MDKQQDVKKQIFLEELNKLNKSNFINQNEFTKIKSAYFAYYSNKRNVINNQVINKSERINSQRQSINQKQIIKPKKSPEQVRERNITLLLILGVIFILISGLILATSTWVILPNIGKTILISMVAVLFLIVSWLAEKVLKINKTSFAFWILGTLFLPVVIISIGYFQLLGNWFSIFGEGKYILGFVGSIICLPFYIYSTYKYKNRLFSWISLITLTLGIELLFGALNVSHNLFYFLTIIYNGLILFGYHKFKNNNKVILFTREIPYFTQINLTLSTFIMLVMYNEQFFYGFNILLIAILYIFMVFSYNRKEYIYVFSGLLVYGIYLIVESTSLHVVNFIIFALIGFIFIGIEKYLKIEENLKKIFRYISGFISLCAFIYISVKGAALGTESSSIVLLISYILISINYLYLSNITNKLIFRWLSPMFFVIASYQIYRLIKPLFTIKIFALFMLVVGIIMFFGLYYKELHKYLRPLKISGVVTSLLVISFSILISISEDNLLLTFFCFYVFAEIKYIIYKKEKSKVIKFITSWSIPFDILFGTIFTYDKLHEYFLDYELMIHFGFSTLILFIIHFILSKTNRQINKTFYWIGHFIMPINIILFILLDYEDNIYIYVIALLIYVYSLLKSKSEFLIKVFLYLSFLMLLVVILSIYALLDLNNMYLSYIPFTSAVIILILWFVLNKIWKKRIAYYVIPLIFLSIIFINDIYNYKYIDFIFSTVLTILAIYIIIKQRWHILNLFAIPLFLSTLYTAEDSIFSEKDVIIFFMYIFAFFIVKFTGEILYKKLYEIKLKEKKFYIDWFAIYSMLIIIDISNNIYIFKNNIFINLIPPMLFTYLIYSQIKRTEGLSKRIILTITAISILNPYYTLLNNISINKYIDTEVTILPWIILVIYLSKRTWKDYKSFMSKVELFILIICSGILFIDILNYNYIQDALIMGGLSLAAVIVGINLKTKSYFFVGIGTLLLNFLIQTREFWGNIPWWVYLLITGLILIVVASINEINKNKNNKDKKEIIRVFKEKFKNWN